MSRPTNRITLATVVLGLGLVACSDGRDAPPATATTAPPVTAPIADRQTEAQQFAEQVVNLGGMQSNDALKMVLGGERFARGSGEFQAGDKIDAVAQLLKDRPEARVMIEGYTDDRGGNAVNQRLSEQRADAVRQALVQRGVDAGRIEVAGRGSAQPVASNETAEGRAQNRRVELTFVADGADRLAAAPTGAPGG
jgi:outer membrane protein OmpA-like peptidoglycan-associated protein